MLIHFSPLKSGQPLYSGQNSWSQCVLYKEVLLYYTCVYIRMYISWLMATSLQWTKWLVPMCSLQRGSTLLYVCIHMYTCVSWLIAAFLQWTKWLVPVCPLQRGSTLLHFLYTVHMYICMFEFWLMATSEMLTGIHFLCNLEIPRCDNW